MTRALLIILVACCAIAQEEGPRRLWPFPAPVAAWGFNGGTTRYILDSVGTNQLTAANTPVAIVGEKVGDCAAFRAAASQKFTAVGTPTGGSLDLNMSNKTFTVAGWIFLSNNVATYAQCYGARSSANPYTNDQWAVDYYPSEGGLRMVTGIGAAALNVVRATAISNSWMLCISWVDNSANMIGIRVYSTNGIAQTVTNKTQILGRGCQFEVGCGRNSSFLGGMIDGLCIFNDLLPTNAMDLLWNWGHGGWENYLTPQR